MDDDHIQGLLELFGEIQVDVDTHVAPPFRIGGLWLNAFDLADLGAHREALAAAVASVGDAAVGAGVGGVGGWSDAVIASVPQARQLSDAATTLGIAKNADFATGLAMAGQRGPVVVELEEGLRLTVVGPNADRIDDLRRTWRAFLKARDKRDPSPDEVATAAVSVDRSVYNLSSIIVLAERGGRTMLLTGDGLGEDILDDLGRAGRLKDGVIHVDLLKMPHHGSIRNVMAPADLLERITADHYVFSANGTSGNP